MLQHNTPPSTLHDCISGKVSAGGVGGAPHHLDENEEKNYHIMQIVRGGKVSRLHDLVIRGKTFAIVQQFETPCNRKAKNLLENLHDWRLIRENRESFPP